MTTSERAVNPQRVGVGLRETKPALAEAFQKRQKDTAWGYALAHDLPFVGLYYAFTRRTITPFLWSTAYSFAAAFAVGIVAGVATIDSGKKTNEPGLEALGVLAAVIASPFGAKHGINQAREYARRRLDSIN